ncbi:MAG: hypothetical protein RLZZ522_2242, partial [Verrucomicrobiota bacterium]
RCGMTEAVRRMKALLTSYPTAP